MKTVMKRLRRVSNNSVKEIPILIARILQIWRTFGDVTKCVAQCRQRESTVQLDASCAESTVPRRSEMNIWRLNTLIPYYSPVKRKRFSVSDNSMLVTRDVRPPLFLFIFAIRTEKLLNMKRNFRSLFRIFLSCSFFLFFFFKELNCRVIKYVKYPSLLSFLVQLIKWILCQTKLPAPCDSQFPLFQYNRINIWSISEVNLTVHKTDR